jgi:hypothetical protein
MMGPPVECNNCGRTFTLENPISLFIPAGTGAICSICYGKVRQSQYEAWEKSLGNTEKGMFGQ